jgi:Zn-dependent protease with chaperone function
MGASFPVIAYDSTAEPRRTKITFVSDGTILVEGRKKEIPLANLHLELGRTGKTCLRIKDSTTGLILTSEDPRLLDAIIKFGGSLEVSETARQLRIHMPDTPRKNVIKNVAIGLLLTTLAFLIWYLPIKLADIAAEQIKPEWEEVLGGKVFIKGFDPKSADAKRVSRVGERLVSTLPNSPYHFHFYVQNSKEVNAYCMIGGNIVVLKGMMDRIKSDDELAGVLGHEIGHALHRDVVRLAAKEMGTDATLALLFHGQANRLKDILTNAQPLEHARFSRQAESAADETGVELAFKAGYKPDAVAYLFERMEKEGSAPDLMIFLSDHPGFSSRIEAVKEEARKLGTK